MAGRNRIIFAHGARHTAGIVIVTLLVALLALGAAAPAAGQSSPVVTPTPVVGSASGQGAQTPAAQPQQQQPQNQQSQGAGQSSGPVAVSGGADAGVPVLAQGLIYLSGQDIVWQVREVELTEGETWTGGPARVVLQRDGETVVRNDLTGKRARLEAGEAYFASAEDPYSLYPEGESSTLWVFEIANNNNVGAGAFYLSPNVSGYAEGTYDLEFARNVVRSGTPAEYEGGVGPSLLVVISGDVSVAMENRTASLTARDGLVVNGAATIEAESSEAVYVTFTVGDQVADSSAGAPQPQPAQPQQPAGDAGGEDAGAADQPPAAVTNPQPAQPSAEGAYVTSIQVGATSGIAVTIYADGELVFDGWLEPGQWTDFVTGSVFDVYTTSGASTQFINACGEQFMMGQEPGDAYYYLSASAESCAPVT